MSFLEHFEIELAKNGGDGSVYEPGETIRGKLIIKTKEMQSIKQIYLEINGEAYIHWYKNEYRVI